MVLFHVYICDLACIFYVCICVYVFIYSRTIALVELMFLLIKPTLNKVYFTLLYFTLLRHHATFSGNVAYDKSARQVLGTWGEHGANRVIDGDLSPKVDDGYCACPLDGTEREPAWWQVDLGMPYVVLGLNITNPDAELCECVYPMTYEPNWPLLLTKFDFKPSMDK